MKKIKLSEMLDKLRRVELNTRNVVIKALQDIPINDHVTSVAKNCFTVSSGIVFSEDVWSPEYYNFKHTVEHMCKYIKLCKTESIIPYLTEIVTTGSIRYPYHGYTTYVAIPVREYVNDTFFDGELEMLKSRGKSLPKTHSTV